MESGQFSSSKYVRPVCDVLSIPEPNNFANEDDRSWVQLGRLLRSRNMEQFRRAMSLVESMVGPDDKVTAPEAVIEAAPKSK